MGGVGGDSGAGDEDLFPDESSFIDLGFHRTCCINVYGRRETACAYWSIRAFVMLIGMCIVENVVYEFEMFPVER